MGKMGLIRFRYNTMADQTPGGEWKWRIVVERGSGFHEVLAKKLVINVPSFSTEDDMPVVGRKFHIACYGIFRIEDGVCIVDSAD
jgi:hypothetical protein